MNKFHNKGVTFFEIVIAVAIFAILMCPIVAKLIEAMKISDSAKVAQNKYELAENLIENVKNSSDFMPEQTVAATSSTLPEYTLTKATTNSFLTEITNGSVTKYPYPSDSSIHVAQYEKEDGTPTTIPYSDYVLTGKSKVGKQKKDCYYAISVSNEGYAALQSEGKLVDNPNNSTLSTIENLDANKVALIDGTIGNYDSTVTSAFMSQKLDILKVGDKNRWEQYTKQQAEIVAFPNDTVTRVVEVSVKSDNGDKTKGERKYTVTCKLRYMENTDIMLKDGIYHNKPLKKYLKPIEYVVYEKTFTGKLPHIYLMYNPCLYNSNYMENDYIVLDTSQMDIDEKHTDAQIDAMKKNGKEKDIDKNVSKVEFYVVETAEQFSDTAAAAYQDAYKEVTGKEVSDAATKYLVNNKTYRDRSDVTVNIIGTEIANKADTSRYLTIYNNFNINPSTDMNLPDTISSYGSLPPNSPLKESLDKAYQDGLKANNKKNSNIKLTNDYPADLIPKPTPSYYSMMVKQIKKLDDAKSAASPLYDVKVYLADEPFDTSDYDTLTKQLKKMTPTISGTKGGN